MNRTKSQSQVKTFICQVNCFDQIIPYIREPGTLILCDIDDTVLTPKPIINIPGVRSNVLTLLLDNGLKPTDKSGFLRMYHHLHSDAIKGQLMFLTARHELGDFETRKDLQMLGIPLEPGTDLVIHYTNNYITKGEYITRFLQSHVKNNRPVIFIDDRIDFIRSVIEHHPTTKCFMYTHLS